MDKLSCIDSPLRFKHLQITGIGLTSKGSGKIASYLKHTSNTVTTSLTLELCRFISDEKIHLLPRMQPYNNLKKLCVITFVEWLRFDSDFCQMLSGIKTLEEFHISCNIGFHCTLVKSLSRNNTLKRLVLESDLSMYTSDNEQCLQLKDASANIIQENKTLAELRVEYHQFDQNNCACTLANALCENNTLKKIEMKIHFGLCCVVAFASMREENTTLEEYHFVGPS